MKKTVCLILTLFMILPVICSVSVLAENDTSTVETFDVPAKSAVLMDYNTGTVIYEKNADEALAPASVTKVMTLLLIMEAVDNGTISYDDMISVSEYASSMGGSQVFLEPGESLRADELIKSIVIASANDAAVAMAEAVGGSETSFVQKMNARAKELGMTNTNFENVTGLDDDVDNHVTSARDIAIMSRALMTHEKIFEYSTVWMDSIREGAFGLTNTNRLIRFYNGATGLKTGSTEKAGFCISATAKREELHLIAVIMGAETRDIRNEAAKTLLDYGFANYSIYKSEGGILENIDVKCGVINSVNANYAGCEILVKRGQDKNITVTVDYEQTLTAPVKVGQKIGSAKYMLDGNIIHETDVTAVSDIPKISFLGLLCRMIGGYILK